MRSNIPYALLAWALSAFALQVRGQFAALNVFEGSDAASCNNGRAAVATAYAPLGLCLVQFNVSGAAFPGLRVQASPRIEYFSETSCNQTSFWANGSSLACANAGPRLRANLTSLSSSTPPLMYNVNYFADASCSGAAVSYAPGSGVLVSGLLAQCTASMSLQVFAGGSLDVAGYSIVDRVNASHVLVSAFPRNETSFSNCTAMDERSGRWVLPIGACVPAVWGAANSSTPFMLVSLDPLPVRPIRMYVGQIDLNAEDSALNAQIVGASVGILCGLTTFLVLVSMTGLLD